MKVIILSFVSAALLVSCGSSDDDNSNKAPEGKPGPALSADEISLTGPSLSFPFSAFSCRTTDQSIPSRPLETPAGLIRIESLTAAMPAKDKAVLALSKVDQDGTALCNYRVSYSINSEFSEMTQERYGVSGDDCGSFVTQVQRLLGDKVALDYDKPRISWVAISLQQEALKQVLCTDGNTVQAYFRPKAP